MLSKKHTVRNIAIICILALPLSAILYLSSQKQNVYKAAFKKRVTELIVLQDKTDLISEKLDYVQKALDETEELIT